MVFPDVVLSFSLEATNVTFKLLERTVCSEVSREMFPAFSAVVAQVTGKRPLVGVDKKVGFESAFLVRSVLAARPGAMKLFVFSVRFSVNDEVVSLKCDITAVRAAEAVLFRVVSLMYSTSSERVESFRTDGTAVKSGFY